METITVRASRDDVLNRATSLACDRLDSQNAAIAAYVDKQIEAAARSWWRRLLRRPLPDRDELLASVEADPNRRYRIVRHWPMAELVELIAACRATTSDTIELDSDVAVRLGYHYRSIPRTTAYELQQQLTDERPMSVLSREQLLQLGLEPVGPICNEWLLTLGEVEIAYHMIDAETRAMSIRRISHDEVEFLNPTVAQYRAAVLLCKPKDPDRCQKNSDSR